MNTTAALTTSAAVDLVEDLAELRIENPFVPGLELRRQATRQILDTMTADGIAAGRIETAVHYIVDAWADQRSANRDTIARILLGVNSENVNR